MPSLQRGDVIVVNFPNADLATFKRRPALVIQSNELHSEYDDWIVAMISTRPRRTGPTTLLVERDSDAGRAMGLPADSLLVVHRITTVADFAVESKLGECPLMDEVDVALRHVFAL
jgi:mRNA interferase MazF